MPKFFDAKLGAIRRYLPNFGGLDFSPIVLLLAIYLVRSYLAIAAARLVAG